MKRMRQRIRISAVLLAMVLAAALCPGAQAATTKEYETLTVELPYRHLYTTTDPAVDSLFHYIIEAKEGNGDLPAEADGNGVFTFQGNSGPSVTSGRKTIYDRTGTLHFTFTKPGEYTYLVRADKVTDGKKVNAERYYFEAREYLVSFYIANDESASGSLKLRMLTAGEREGMKTNDVEMDPTYTSPEPTPTPTPKGTTPRIGDETPLGLYMTLLLGSGLLLLLITARGFRGKAKKGE